MTERTEETPLLNEDEARRLNLDEVILVIDAQMPIRAWRIKYYEDPALKVIHAGQSGSHPYPDAEKLRYEARLKETEETVERLSRELSAVAGAPGKKARKSAAAPVPAAPRLRAPLRRETASTPPEPIRIDLTALGTVGEGRQAVEAAVLKTAGILAQHAPGA